MSCCHKSVLHVVLGAGEWSQGTLQSPVHVLTFRQLHDMLTPTALQRSELGPSARCPAAPPYSVGSGDGSGWPLRMVLPRQRSTEITPTRQLVLCTQLFSFFPAAGIWVLERLKEEHTTEEHHT